jgi:hypothetical protein
VAFTQQIQKPILDTSDMTSPASRAKGAFPAPDRQSHLFPGFGAPLDAQVGDHRRSQR